MQFLKLILPIYFLFFQNSSFSQIKYQFTLYQNFPELLDLKSDFDGHFKSTLSKKLADVTLRNYLDNDDVHEDFSLKLSQLNIFFNTNENKVYKKQLQRIELNLRDRSVSFSEFRYVMRNWVKLSQYITLLGFIIENEVKTNSQNRWPQKKEIWELSRKSLINLSIELQEAYSEKIELTSKYGALHLKYHHKKNKFLDFGYQQAKLLVRDSNGEKDGINAPSDKVHSLNYLTHWYSQKEISIKNLIELYLSGFILFGLTDSVEDADGLKLFPIPFLDHDERHNFNLSQKKKINWPQSLSLKKSRKKRCSKIKPFLKLYKSGLKEIKKAHPLKKIGFFYFWFRSTHEDGNLFGLNETEYEKDVAAIYTKRSPLINKDFLGLKSIWEIDYLGKNEISQDEALKIVKFSHEFRQKVIAAKKKKCQKKLE